MSNSTDETDSLLSRNNPINSTSLPPFIQKTWKQRHQGKITAFVLFLMSVLNVTDRYTVSSALIDIEVYFNITKSTGGLLQTAFLLVYMAFSLPNGYLGDRINRKYILCVGLVIWMASSILGSFVGSTQFYLFVLSRCAFGIATASFETIAVPILGDTFLNDSKGRTRAVILFNFGPPVGYGLAYLIESVAKDLWPNDWRYTLRLTPFILALTLVIILVGYIEPERFNSTKKVNRVENNNDEVKDENEMKMEKRSFLDDLKMLSKNRTYILLIASWTFGLTSLGGFSWWSSSIIDYSLRNKHLSPSKIDFFKKMYSASQVLAGIVGLLTPVKLSSYFKSKQTTPAIDCFSYSFSFFSASLFIFIYLATIELNEYLSFIVYTFIIVSYNICWITQSYIFLDIVHPRLRSTANGLIIFVLHLVGDSISPYWVGSIADACLAHGDKKSSVYYLMECTQISLYPIVFVAFFGGVFGLFMTLSFEKDRELSKNQTHVKN